MSKTIKKIVSIQEYIDLGGNIFSLKGKMAFVNSRRYANYKIFDVRERIISRGKNKGKKAYEIDIEYYSGIWVFKNLKRLHVEVDLLLATKVEEISNFIDKVKSITDTIKMRKEIYEKINCLYSNRPTM